MWLRRGFLALTITLVLASTAWADTVRVTVERALVWTRPSGVSVVMTQLLMGDTAEVVSRVGDWYEIILPNTSVGAPVRTGFISASQVVVASVGPPTIPLPRPASPQPSSPQRSSRRNSFLNVDSVFRIGRQDLTRTATAFKDVLAEEGTITANYGDNGGWALDAMGGAAIADSIGVGVGLSYFLRDRSVSISASIPHPLFFNQPRTASFESEKLSAHEAEVYVPVLWTPRPFGALNVVVFGGPSIFRVSQTVVTAVVRNEVYPFDTVSITGVTTEERKATVFGYHLGGDVSYFFAPKAGVGVDVRFSRATLKFENDEPVTTDGVTGSLQVGVGVRLRF